MSTTFPRARKLGYDIDQVEDFLEDARRAYHAQPGEPTVVTAETIRQQAFTMRKRGYAPTHVDAALERLSSRLGFIMLCHTALDRAAQVARYWAAQDCPVVIHVDKRSPTAAVEMLRADLADLEAEMLLSDMQKMENRLPRLERLVTGYLTTDITYVLFVQRYPQPGQTPEERIARQAYLAGNSLVNWSNWVGSSVIGVALANFIPSEWGLGFAGILCLVGILCSLASTRLRILSAVLAGVAAVVAYALPLKLNIIVAIAVAVFACLALEKTRPVAAAQEPRA